MAETALMEENALYHGARQAIRRHDALLDVEIRRWCAVPPGGRSPSRLAPAGGV